MIINHPLLFDNVFRTIIRGSCQSKYFINLTFYEWYVIYLLSPIGPYPHKFVRIDFLGWSFKGSLLVPPKIDSINSQASYRNNERKKNGGTWEDKLTKD